MESGQSKYLFEKYAILFKGRDDLKASLMGFGFECGAGWFDILNGLFAAILSPYLQAQSWVSICQENLDNRLLGKDTGGLVSKTPTEQLKAQLDEAKKGLEEAAQALPVIVQVKEKFGTLRVYARGADERVHSLIEYACSMSSTVCEECGNKGYLVGKGWYRTLCAEHIKQQHGSAYLKQLSQSRAAHSIAREYFNFKE